MNKPTKFEWIPSDNPLAITEPSASKKNAGWLYREKPAFQYLNWIFNLIAKWLNYYDNEVNQFAPNEANPPNMTIVVEAGRVFSGSSPIVKGQQITTAIVAPTTNPRIDRIAIDRITGNYVYIKGEEAATPIAPNYLSSHYPVCQIRLETTTITISYAVQSSANAQIVNEIASVFLPDKPYCYIYHNDQTARYTVSSILIFNTIQKENTSYSMYDTTTGVIQPQEAGWYEIVLDMNVLVTANTVEYVYGLFNGSLASPTYKLMFNNPDTVNKVISGCKKWVLYFNGDTDYAQISAGTSMTICTDFSSEGPPNISIKKIS